MARILAIDYGKRRVGLAVTDPMKIIASPLQTIETEKVLSFLTEYFKINEVELIILGEPKNLDGEETHSTQAVMEFQILLNKQFPQIPIKLVDERFTSRMAKQVLLDAGYKKKDRQNKKLVDTVSAALILQTYLESQ